MRLKHPVSEMAIVWLVMHLWPSTNLSPCQMADREVAFIMYSQWAPLTLMLTAAWGNGLPLGYLWACVHAARGALLTGGRGHCMSFWLKDRTGNSLVDHWCADTLGLGEIMALLCLVRTGWDLCLHAEGTCGRALPSKDVEVTEMLWMGTEVFLLISSTGKKSWIWSLFQMCWLVF